jgi:hypothetical protein
MKMAQQQQEMYLLAEPLFYTKGCMSEEFITHVEQHQIMLDGVFIVEFHITGQDVKILVAVCSYISSPAIITINLLWQEQLIFNVATDQVIFDSAMAHRGWKLA